MIHFKPKQNYYSRNFFGSFLFLFITKLMLSEGIYTNNLLLIILGGFIFLVFANTLTMMLVRLFDKNEGLVVDDRGISVRMVGTTFFEWKNINKVTITKKLDFQEKLDKEFTWLVGKKPFQNASNLIIDLVNNDLKNIKFDVFTGIFIRFNRLLGWRLNVLPLQDIEIDRDKLIAEIEKYGVKVVDE